ncbi:YndM family protein [Aquibacillus kalidii]|uniref:YndM family protein n=1 Tax=Aquibacillus kalidii TaxID=2762597 RepID=UPI0016457BCE|nr:YndM family protein [Aquibacillus kalidii]
MRHVKALTIKFIATFALLYLILGVLGDLSFTAVFSITVVLGVVSYLIGDLLLLPKTNNIIATVADLGLAFVLIYWMSDAMTPVTDTFGISVIAALAVALCEELFHRYLANNLLPKKNTPLRNLKYLTETSEELAEPTINRIDTDKL